MSAAAAVARSRRTYTWKQAARLAGCTQRQLYWWLNHSATISQSAEGWTADDVFQARLVARLRKAGLVAKRIRRVLALVRPGVKYLAVTAHNACALKTPADVVYFAAALPGPVLAVVDIAECAEGL